MRQLFCARFAAAVSASVALAACSSTAVQPGPATPAQMSFARAGHAHPLASFYKVLFHFRGDDGSKPLGDLLAVNGVLYGTTSAGGANGKGTVYSITTAGVQHVLYSFKGGSDGSTPTAGLAELDGTLYGTTYAGGAGNGGTVFSISPITGTEKVLHSFLRGTDGADPRAGLVSDGGKLYGTTERGGHNRCHALGCGTVYFVTTAGVEHIIYSFKGGTDGQEPRAGLALLNGSLYGTTRYGGSAGQGTLFGVTTAGAESVLYYFGGSRRAPTAPEYGTLLVDTQSVVGATSRGGTTGCGGGGCGLIYSVNPSNKGALSEVTEFQGGSGGATPVSTLTTTSAGTLTSIYGTTLEGGSVGDGIAFTVVNGGVVVLHSFTGGKDGAKPYSGLTPLNGALYGTTNGADSHGTVYEIIP